jgi:hypothetical protein
MAMIDNPTLLTILTIFLGVLVLGWLWRLGRMLHSRADRPHRSEPRAPFTIRRSPPPADDERRASGRD